jgi:TM2 domain-containing membrane protein YozV
MKKKETAAILAFTSGFAGTHEFYLGRVAYGFCMIILMIWKFKLAFIIGIIQGIRLLAMSSQEFNMKYLNVYQDFQKTWNERRSNGNTQENNKPQNPAPEKKDDPIVPSYTNTVPPAAVDTKSLREEGVKKYKEYDFQSAIIAFEKIIAIEPNDQATLFNLACCYSILEEKEKAFEYLKKAVENGLKDVERLKKHDGLAHLRVQPEWDNFILENF